MYTFELIFAGLCLFTFQGDSAATVHLVNATKNRDATCESDVRLPVHNPYLVFKTGMDGVTFPPDHRCVEEGRSQVCPLDERDLSLVLVGDCSCGGDDCWDFDPVNDLRRVGQNLPFEPEEVADLGWLASLHQIDGKKIKDLKPKVDDNIVGNKLIVSRVRLDKGKLKTLQLEREYGTGAIIPFRPRPLRPPEWDPAKADHPKALSAVIASELAGLPMTCKVTLQDINDEMYKWEFLPTTPTKLQVAVINRPEEDRLGPKVGNAPYAYPDRMRHFLWFYELVSWKNNCPDLLSAPLCPTDECRRLNLVPDWIRAGNHFCPPATYP